MKAVPICELGRVVTGKTPSIKDTDNYGGNVPFITPSDMDNRRIIASTGRYLSEKGTSVVKSSVIPEDAVMVSCIGSDMGKTHIAGCRAVTNQQINSVIIDREDISPLFLYYNLRGRRGELRSLAVGGSAQPILNKSNFSQIEISFPNKDVQDQIAALLGALDDKIELNRKTAATLEAMARALYRSWFVDFDPVHARAEGRAPAHMDPATAALFPDRFDEDGLPEGWERKSLDDIATFLNGAALQKYPAGADDEYLPVIKIAELRSGPTAKTGRASTKIPEKFWVADGDVLFSWSGSLLQKTWTYGPGALNQHLFKVSSGQVPKWFHFYAVDHHLEDFQQAAASKATTMGHIQRHHLRDAFVVLPPEPIMDAANSLMRPLFDRGVSASLESKQLAALRDTLLPKLMSGELRVGDAEALVGEVA